MSGRGSFLIRATCLDPARQSEITAWEAGDMQGQQAHELGFLTARVTLAFVFLLLILVRMEFV